jgi:cell division protein FtsB
VNPRLEAGGIVFGFFDAHSRVLSRFDTQFGDSMNKKTWAGLGLLMVLGLSLAACQDTKAREENERLKAQVLQLQKDAGDLGNRIDVLTKENTELKQEIDQLKTKHPVKKSSKSKRHRSKPKAAASTQD